MGLGQYKSLGEYCNPNTASSVFIILILCYDSFCPNNKTQIKLYVAFCQNGCQNGSRSNSFHGLQNRIQGWPRRGRERLAVFAIKDFPRGGDLVSTLPGCVCRKVKDIGPFSASSE